MCGVQEEHRVALGPIKNPSENAIELHADARSKNQDDQGNNKRWCNQKARKGGTATQASQGTHQANQTGQRQGKRPKEQASSHPSRLTNKNVPPK